ncbi:unnamed protein product [Musa acuminata subsp. malaccensis]|uniref:(wild Malaysian banana) hypothetical protein n=1 Tax=Musa acuminata subsp. malaccensis TaxID=214687 RepID=A0A804KMZ3_MUSAM|nr:unnamed protein product [Musa acuminata subsp. malaccensis]
MGTGNFSFTCVGWHCRAIYVELRTYLPACGVIKSTRYIAFFLSFSSVSSLSQHLSGGGDPSFVVVPPVCSSSFTAYTTIAQDQICHADFILLRLHDLYLLWIFPHARRGWIQCDHHGSVTTM